MTQKNNGKAIVEFDSDQLVPHSIEAEKAVLGSVLINPACLGEISYLNVPDFFIVRHGWIWEAMQAIQRDEKIALDYLTLVQRLEQLGKLAELGGAAYVLSLMNSTPSALNVEGYARLVQRFAVRRRLLDAASTLARLAHSDNIAIEEVLEQAEKAVVSVRDAYVGTVSQARDAADLALEVLVEMENAAEKKPQTLGFGLTGDLEPVSRALDGIEPSLVYWIAARPGTGKSSLLAQMAATLALDGRRVLLFSLEMTAEAMMRRMICQRANVPAYKLRHGLLSDVETARARKVGNELADCVHRLRIEARSGMTVSTMRAIARAMERERGLDVVMIDTVTRVKGAGEKAYERMTSISHEIADWAHASRYAVLGAVQLSRAAAGTADPRPRLEHLRDTGAFEEDADVVIGGHRPGQYKPEDPELEHLAVWYVLKNREGESGQDVEMYWDPTCTAFRRLATRLIEVEDTKRKKAG